MQSVKFKNPPLIEVVFGVNIELSELSLVHFGLYWDTIKDRFPTPVETIGELNLTEDYSYVSSFPTVWYLSSQENKLIRLTNDYFSYHCRCINEEYPHFENLFTEFLNEWRNLESWWLKINDNSIESEGYSLQYINLIDEDSGWKSFEDNEKIFTFIGKPIKTSFGMPKINSSKFEFDLPDKLGTLNVSLERQKIERAETESTNIMLFSLSVISLDIATDSLESWFSSSHNFIIQSFLELTQEEVQRKNWEREV
jgi:uncharacterized protein (TIGR04255 family)